ncbi:MAG TPA: RyR domain-containing protein, partial [bacterium]|nr:RyR domain-containing protein [bacterium]
SAGAACFSRTGGRRISKLERFVYRPDELEGMWREKNPGITYGTSSILTAAIARHRLDEDTYPLFMALSRGLGAAHTNHRIGGGDQAEFKPDAGEADIAKDLCGKGKTDPINEYSSSFDPSILTYPPRRQRGKSDLLLDLTGVGFEYVAAKAVEVVMWGTENALRHAPQVRYGKFYTVDRDEIERINGVRNLMLSYKRNPKDTNPLAIAVFGLPGSGKSFAIKQLARGIFANDRKALSGERKVFFEYNLSQMADVGELHRAFHQVRDASVQGQIPIVIWDEFDCRGLEWLQYFLEPVQDAQFRAAGDVHPFGKAVFVFAGGTSRCFEDFDLSKGGESAAKVRHFKDQKGPDFVSRLRGFVNIKGPDKIVPDRKRKRLGNKSKAATDSAYILRRAIVLRDKLAKYHPQLIDTKGRALVSPGIISAFLRVKNFEHGNRSIDALVSMSSVDQERHFGPAQLPSEDLLNLHVKDGFLKQVRRCEFSADSIEALAQAWHEAWCKCKRDMGYTPGPDDDEKKTNHLLKPYADLTEDEKEANRTTARVLPAKLLDVGLELTRKSAKKHLRLFTPRELKKLARLEHDRWLREKLVSGFTWAKDTERELRLHRDVTRFSKVPKQDQKLDYETTKTLPQKLWDLGYVLARKRKRTTKAARTTPKKRIRAPRGKPARAANR